ncbi:hypothetical protein FRB96_006233 [Tulasnella sp. 330]|nr:hypothetical protein FRB96_006233 [Tulasnella sp. 330]
MDHVRQTLESTIYHLTEHSKTQKEDIRLLQEALETSCAVGPANSVPKGIWLSELVAYIQDKAALADQNQHLRERNIKLNESNVQLQSQVKLQEEPFFSAERQRLEMVDAGRQEYAVLRDRNTQLETATQAWEEKYKLSQDRYDALSQEMQQALKTAHQENTALSEENETLLEELEIRKRALSIEHDELELGCQRETEAQQEITHLNTEQHILAEQNMELKQALRLVQEQNKTSQDHLEAVVKQQKDELDALQRRVHRPKSEEGVYGEATFQL